jgi:NADH-quinone oxidoreductase subunit J
VHGSTPTLPSPWKGEVLESLIGSNRAGNAQTLDKAILIRNVVFIVLAAVTLGSALLTVTVRNIFHAALWLALCFAGVAGIYVMLHAEFLFAVQLLIYVGAIAVLILFAVMLSRELMGERMPATHTWGQILAAIVLTIALFVIGIQCLWPLIVNKAQAVTPAGLDMTSEIGKGFLTYHLLPFEIASIVLLVALAGAVYLAKPDPRT